MLRAETREEHPSGDEAAGYLDGQEFPLEEQSLQTTEAADEDEADQPLPRVRPQGRDHCRRNHGRIPDMLGALLLRQHCRSLLQDLHISSSISGARDNNHNSLLCARAFLSFLDYQKNRCHFISTTIIL